MLARRALVPSLLSVGLAGCVAAKSASTTPASNTSTSSAVNLWGIALGMGQAVLAVAEATIPGVAAAAVAINAIIAAATPLVAAAQTDVAAAAQLKDQATALITVAAPLVSVFANGSPA